MKCDEPVTSGTGSTEISVIVQTLLYEVDDSAASTSNSVKTSKTTAHSKPSFAAAMPGGDGIALAPPTYSDAVSDTTTSSLGLNCDALHVSATTPTPLNGQLCYGLHHAPPC